MWTVPYSGPDNVEAVGGDPSRPGYERHRVRAALFRTAVSTCVSVAIRPPSPVVAAPILEEYIRVLAYPKFTLTRAEIHGLIEEELLPFVETITATPVVIPRYVTRTMHISSPAQWPPAYVGWSAEMTTS